MNFQHQAKRTLEIESQAITNLISRIDDSFDQACLLIRTIKGRVVVIGMGKSGHIGHKIAATLASTGTPAFFVHPAEASHGDLGMITADDIVLALSNSGETREILAILPMIKRQGIPMIALTGNINSTLAKQASIHLDVSVEQEACPLNLAPTASSTATLALGDALAVALLDAKGFNAEDFARSHPGGKLGKKLLTYVADIMRTGDELPISKQSDSILQAIMTISRYGMGFTVISAQQRVLGVFTDGDLRRLLDTKIQQSVDFSKLLLVDYMTQNPSCINETILADEALQVMEAKRISAIPVVNSAQQLVGAINMHDLLKSGIA